MNVAVDHHHVKTEFIAFMKLNYRIMSRFCKILPTSKARDLEKYTITNMIDNVDNKAIEIENINFQYVHVNEGRRILGGRLACIISVQYLPFTLFFPSFFLFLNILFRRCPVSCNDLSLIYKMMERSWRRRIHARKTSIADPLFEHLCGRRR